MSDALDKIARSIPDNSARLNLSDSLIAELVTDFGLDKTDEAVIKAWWADPHRSPAGKLSGQRIRLIGKFLEERQAQFLGMAGKIPPFTIVVDTREQVPFAFDGLESVRKGLKVGDYSLVGFESLVAIERKSKSDAWNCVAGERDRFIRELEKLAQYDRAAIVIECALAEFCVRPAQLQRVSPATAVGSFISWSVQYNIPVFWCDNRAYAERVTLRFLMSWLKHRSEKVTND